MNEKYFGTVFIDAAPSNGFPENFAILTAFNPMDRILNQDVNTKRNQHLLDILKLQGHYSGTILGIVGCVALRFIVHSRPSEQLEIEQTT